jgi:hypothetical protein
MVKPGGTGTPIRVISARLAPLPPSSARIRRGGFTLQIDKADHFAWVTAPWKYRDFVLEAALDFDPGNGHCAAGFVLRYINEENFYYFLVSSQYKRFIELIWERKAEGFFKDKYTAVLSTSIHFFDHTAHNYMNAICDDLEMKYLGFFYPPHIVYPCSTLLALSHLHWV